MNAYALIVAITVSTMSYGSDRASRESAERLLILTDVKVLVDRMHEEVDRVADGLLEHASKGRTISSAEKKELGMALADALAEAKKSISWESMCDLYVPLYQEAFTQKEIEELVVFYESPTGKAFMAKMPGVTQQAATIMRQRLVPVMGEIKATATRLAAKYQQAQEK